MRFCGLLFLLTVVSGAFALDASQVLVVVNADEPASVSVGSYYVKRRALPQINLIPLRLGKSSTEILSRKQYVEQVVVPIRKLLQKPQYSSIRCLLTTYKMPYKISAPEIDNETASIIADLESIAFEKIKQLVEIVLELSPESTIASAGNLASQLSVAKNVIDSKISLIKATTDATQREAKVHVFLETCMPLYGAFITPQISEMEFEVVYKLSGEIFVEAVESRKFVETAIEQLWGYRKCIDNDYYDQFAKVYGTLELLESLNKALRKLKGVEVSSAFDSELTLVKKTAYEWYLWQNNDLRNNLDDVSTLMVSRIDGPSENICREIIDKSLSAEKSGVRGSVCVDARYDDDGGPAGYNEYDKSLRIMAKTFEEAGFDVVLEETERLFKSSKPLETAFYCGWYSLENYVDSFDFAVGAVGYHMSSLEACDIRDDSSGQWVASMLVDGVVATLGAVDEPYLKAFPKPDEFFACLLEGLTIAEAYAKTNPYNSWQMVLIADPLYRPLGK